MPSVFSKSFLYKIFTYTVVTASLAACGGGSSGGGGGGTAVNNANGLLDEAQGCAYLLGAPFNISAAELNQLGCAYVDANGNTAYWQGTEGNFGPDSAPDFNDDEDLTNGVAGTDTTSGIVDQVAPTTDLNTGGTSTSGIVDQTDPTTDTNTGGTSTSGITTGPVDDGTNVPDSTVVTNAQPLTPELLDNGTGAIYSQAVNSALLSGAVVGTGEQLNSNLYKSIGLTTLNMPIDMEILHALVHDNGFDSAYMIMHLRNNGSDVRCFVNHGETEAYNAAGNVIATGLLEFGYIDGSLGITAGGTYTDTCVAPGEIVYISQLFSNDVTLDEIVSVQVSDLEFSADSRVADLAVKPISYTVDVDGVNVLVANQSSQTIEISTSNLFLLTDEGVPVYYDLEFHDDVLLPGAETVLTYRTRFIGSSTNIRVILDYSPVE